MAELLAVRANADDEVLAATLFDAADDLALQTRAVLDALATVLVIAMIPNAGSEAQQKVAVGGVHFDAV